MTTIADAPAAADTTAFDQWAVVELLGHRRLAGRVREVQLAGAGFLRVDIPGAPGHPAHTSYYGPGAVYGVHPVAEDVARSVAARCRPEPVHRWELPAAAPARPPVDADDLNDGYLAHDVATAELGQDLDDLADLDADPDEDPDDLAAS